ncbi:MAG: hypothetical protein M3N97_07315 [Pseudomonadota bacterium]|nr:hypothetical protein [Pseudomonadota bacterium]
MSECHRTVRDVASLAVIAGILAGCGGSSSTAPATMSQQSAPIVGIATPATVSVVTATNAN